MDGYALLREWKADATLARVPFIVYTATYTEPKDEKLALDLGADAFIVKPAEPEPSCSGCSDVLDAGPAGRAAVTRAGVWRRRQRSSSITKCWSSKLEQKSAQLEQRVGELVHSEAHIKRLNRLYAALSETNQAIVHLSDRDALFEAVCRIAVERGGFTLAWIGMLDEPAATRSCRSPGTAIDGAGWRASAPSDRAPAPHAGRDSRWRGSHLPVQRPGDRSRPRADPRTPPAQRAHGGDVLPAADRRAQRRRADPVRGRGRHYFDDALTSLVTEMAHDVSFALENFEKEARRERPKRTCWRARMPPASAAGRSRPRPTAS